MNLLFFHERTTGFMQPSQVANDILDLLASPLHRQRLSQRIRWADIGTTVESAQQHEL